MWLLPHAKPKLGSPLGGTAAIEHVLHGHTQRYAIIACGTRFYAEFLVVGGFLLTRVHETRRYPWPQ